MSPSTFLVVTAALAAGQGTQPAAREWKPVGRFDRTIIRESSGVVRSPKHDAIFWTHSDSGNAAEIFAIRQTGEIVARVPVEGALNGDWEDIAADDEGYLYIADAGNNKQLHVQRQIYKLREPDPFADPPASARVETVYSFSYVEPFDAEGLFVYRRHLYLISKSRKAPTRLYHLKPLDEQRPDRLKPEALGILPLTLVTGADAASAADTHGQDARATEHGQDAHATKLAVCTGNTLAVYRIGGPSPLPASDALIGQVWFPHGSVEACGFDGDDVVLTAESGEVYRVTAQDLEQRVRFR